MQPHGSKPYTITWVHLDIENLKFISSIQSYPFLRGLHSLNRYTKFFLNVKFFSYFWFFWLFSSPLDSTMDIDIGRSLVHDGINWQIAPRTFNRKIWEVPSFFYFPSPYIRMFVCFSVFAFSIASVYMRKLQKSQKNWGILKIFSFVRLCACLS